MNILALDQSVTRSGFAVLSAPGPRVIESGSFAAAGSGDEERLVGFVTTVTGLIEAHRPGFLVWEAPSAYIAGYPKRTPDLLGKDQGRWTVNSRQLLLPQLHGALLAIATLRRLPFDVVPAATWRAAIFGRGGGRLGRDEAKAKAVAYCQVMKLPARNTDAAEAVCIGLWGATCSLKLKHLGRVRHEG